MRILIIEDSDSIRRMIEALVSARGYAVDAVPNGSKGLEIAHGDSPPDIILLDLNLPGQYDGFEVCRRIRAHASTAKTPVVIISAMTDEQAKHDALEAGANAYYTKPFSPLALLKEIEKLGVKLAKTGEHGP